MSVVPLWYHLNMALTLRTDQQLEDALTALSQFENASRQEVIRRAVLERYERTAHTAKVEDVGSKMLDRWANVLERLGE